LSDLRRATERIEREEFDRGNIGRGEVAAEPRPAATIVMAWATPAEPYRVLLLRRPDSARFAAGAHVFAGGAIDAADASPEAIELLPDALREPEPAAAVAALREMFEETGFLPTDDPVDATAVREARKRLLAGESDFAAAAGRLGATFRNLKATYLSRWITPTRFARRYDTHFFLTVLEATDPPTPELTNELSGYLWITPEEAVSRFAAGDLPMLFPTRKTLQMLERHAELDRLLEEARDRVPVPIQPRLLIRGDSIRPVLPGDPGYEEAD